MPMLGEQAMYRTLTNNVRYIVWPLTGGNAKIYLLTKIFQKDALRFLRTRINGKDFSRFGNQETTTG